MPNITFYAFSESNTPQALLFACRLIEKCYANHQKIYIHTTSQEEAERVDTLLWTYREDNFIPHNFYGSNEEPMPPIQIGHGQTPDNHHDTLVNLTQEIPAFYKQFQHVIEIVLPEPAQQQYGRERYRRYRDQAHEIATHRITANELHAKNI